MSGDRLQGNGPWSRCTGGTLPVGSECAGECRTYVDAGTGLMAYSTLAVQLAVLVLMVRSLSRRHIVLMWPLVSILVLVAVGIVSFLLVAHGLDSSG
ncbi:hypothetical protein AW168_38085 [Nocardia brasiliensis]|nr:hypothetical protein AW168_38085 [Nocardia brasiliensis]